MEIYNNKIKAVIGKPSLDVKASNIFPLINEDVILSTTSKWLNAHVYSLQENSVDSIARSITPVLGHSDTTITVTEEAELLQQVTGSNASGATEVKKILYVIPSQTTPYYNITVTKEIVRTDEEFQIELEGEYGYNFTGNYTIQLKVLNENSEDVSQFDLTEADFSLQPNGKLLSNPLLLPIRGIYDIYAKIIEIEGAGTPDEKESVTEKRINKLVTVTPSLAPRHEAHEVTLVDAGTSAALTVINATQFPEPCTIVLKIDPTLPLEYASRVSVSDLKGTWENPYIITIDDPVTVHWYSWFGFDLGNCAHVVIDGRGYQNLSKGLKLRIKEGFSRKVSALAASKGTEELEIFEVDIKGADFAGMLIKTDPHQDHPQYWYPNFKMNRLLIHHVSIGETEGEGQYIGHFTMSPYTRTNSQGQSVTFRAHHIYDSRFYRSHIYDCGYDSAQWNQLEDMEMCYNLFERGGNRRENNQSIGVNFGGSGKFYNNIITGWGGVGFQINPLAEFQVFNNIIANGTKDSMCIFLVAEDTVPESNPDGTGINNIPVHIYNNVLYSESRPVFSARDTAQYRNVNFHNNFCVSPIAQLMGGQSATTVQGWLARASHNIHITTWNDINMDSSYKIADSSNNDFRISQMSSLRAAGKSPIYPYDFRGYRLWPLAYPIGPFSGLLKESGVNTTFRILTMEINFGQTSTSEDTVQVTWDYFSSHPLAQYRIGESPSLAGVPWKNLMIEELKGPVFYTFNNPSSGIKTLYLQLKNSNDEVTAVETRTITKTERTALIGINSTITVGDGIFEESTGIHSLRFANQVGVLKNFKDTLGVNWGTIITDRAITGFLFEGKQTGNNSGIYPDYVLNRNIGCMLDLGAKTIDPTTTLTLNIAPGYYKVSLFSNGNQNIGTGLPRLTHCTPYAKFNVGGQVQSAVKLFENYDTHVDFNDVEVGPDGVLTISIYWDSAVLSDPAVATWANKLYNVLNLVKIQAN